MRIIARRTLVEFWSTHPETKPALQHWLNVAKSAEWKSIEGVLASFSKAKGLNSERVRFEVAGCNYRMIVAFDFKRSIAFVKFIGTHAEYDRVNALKVSRY